MKKIILVFFIVFKISFAETLYDIAEPDAYEEIKASVPIAIEKFKKEREKIKERILNTTGMETTPADRSYKYFIDPTYVVQEDIPRVDKYGNIVGILYPKGYRFNPLEYLNEAPEPMIVFNPCDKKEKEFVKRLIKKIKGKVILVSSNCPIRKWKDEYGYPLFILTKEVKEKFGIKNTVSLITANMKKKVMEVEVFKVN